MRHPPAEIDRVLEVVRMARDAASAERRMSLMLSIGHVNRLLDHVHELRALNHCYRSELERANSCE